MFSLFLFLCRVLCYLLVHACCFVAFLLFVSLVPPALWATGGLEAPSFQESFFPEPLFPLGRGFNPSPTPPRGPWTAQLRIVRPPFGGPQRFQERSKNHYFFSSNFESILVPFWLPKWLPKATQNVTKSTKSQPKHEKDEFLKMSTSLTRETNFRGSRVPKTPPKSTKNAPKVHQKSQRFLHRFLDCFYIEFGSILGPPWAPFGRQNR